MASSGNQFRLWAARAAQASAGGTALSPSASWSGSANSGWGAGSTYGSYAKPTVPTRVNAAPSGRPVWLQHHFCTGADGSDYLVIAAADVKGGGIQKVRYSTEGNFVDVTTKRWVSETDLRGTTRRRYGYVVQLDYAAAQAAHANGVISVCAEIWSNDGTYTKQVFLDRFVHFRPGAALTAGNSDSRYDVVKTVGPSGRDYTTLGAAQSFAAGSSQYVGIKIMTTGTYPPVCATTVRASSSRPTEVFADTGVTATLCNYNSTSFFDLDATRFRGVGLQFDTSATGSNSPAWFLGSGSVYQFEGVEIYTGNANGAAGITGSGSSYLIDGEQPNQFWMGGIGSNSHIEFKDVYAHDLSAYGLSFAESIINCDQTSVSGSCCENVVGIVHGGSVNKAGGYWSGLNSHVDSISISYGGGGGTASLTHTTTSNGSTAAGNGTFGFLNLYLIGVFATSFNLSTYATFSALATAINAYGLGFSATAQPGAILNTSYISKTGLNPSDPLYPAVSFTAGSIMLTSIADIHANCVVHHSATYTNFICQFLSITDLVDSAGISQDDTATLIDCHYGNFFERDESDAQSQTAQRGYLRGAYQHVGFESITVRGVGSGEYLGGPDKDAYSMMKNCYINTMFWSGGQDTDFVFQGVVNNATPLIPGASTGAPSWSKLITGSESAFLDLTTGVPVVSGGLLLGNGDTSGAKCFAANVDNSDTGNYGWNLSVP